MRCGNLGCINVIYRVVTRRFDVSQGMWSRLSGPIDKSNQSWICSQMNNIIEEGHITQAIFIL